MRSKLLLSHSIPVPYPYHAPLHPEHFPNSLHLRPPPSTRNAQQRNAGHTSAPPAGVQRMPKLLSYLQRDSDQSFDGQRT